MNGKTVLTGTERRLSDRIRSFTLPNGLEIHVIPVRRAPVFAAQFWIDTGSIHEEQDLGRGLSHFLEHMVFNGTSRWPDARTMREKVTELGLYSNAWTSYAETVYVQSGPSEALFESLELLSSMVSEPLFPRDAFLKEKDVILRECDMTADDPERVLFRAVFRDLFQVSPLRVPVIGTRDGIGSVDRDIMTAYYERRYSPHRCRVVVAGDAVPEKVFEFLAKRLSGWKRRPGADPVIPVEPPHPFPVRSVSCLSDPLARCGLSFLLPGSGVRYESAAVDVLVNILGGQDSSRLPAELKTKQGLVTDVDAGQFAIRENGMIRLDFEAPPENVEKALDSVRGILRSVCEKGVSREELARSVRRVRCSSLDFLRSSSSLARTVGRCLRHYGSCLPLDLYADQVAALTPDDIRAAAEKYLAKSEETLTMVLPEEKRTAPKPVSPLPPPRVRKLALSSEKDLVFVPDPESPFSGITLILCGGPAWEEPSEISCSSLLAECLFCGCEGLSETEFRQKLDDLSIHLSVHASAEGGILISMESLKEDFPAALDLLVTMLRAPAFPREAVEREKKRLADLYLNADAQPIQAAVTEAGQLVFGKRSPYARPMKDRVESVRKLGPKQLRSFFREKVLLLRHARFGASGAFTENEALRTFRRILRSVPWNRADRPFSSPRVPRARIEGKALVRPKNQTVAIYALPAPPMEERESDFAMQLCLSALAHSGSVIFDEIREKRGLAYFASILQISCPGDGCLMFYAGIRDDAVKETFAVFEGIRRRLARKGLTKDELRSAGTRLRASLMSRMEDSADLCELCVRDQFLGRGMNRYRELLELLEKPDPEAVNRVVRTVFSSPVRKWVVVSPEKFAKKSPFS